MEQFNDFDIIIKRKVLFEFIVNVVKPLEKFKKDELKN